MGKLTTHVLDTARGRPGAGIKLSLSRIEDGTARQLRVFVTNDDGRCDEPLLEGDAMVPGVYQLTFQIAQYFESMQSSDPVPFLDDVVIRFGIASADQHYHVPVLVSPYGYTTYRGS